MSLGTYFTVVIPWSDKPTKWHPTEQKGPFSVLSRGCFPNGVAALEWAEKNLEGQPYSVRGVEAPWEFTCEAIAITLRNPERSLAQKHNDIVAFPAEVGIKV